MYESEGWTIKKAECQRIDAFELWCWRRLLRVPWTARRSNQSILKDQSWVFIGRTDAEAEAPILWPPHTKTLMLGKFSGRRRDRQRMRWLDGITDSTDMNLSKFQEMVKDREAWCAAIHEVSKSRTRLIDWIVTATRLPKNVENNLLFSIMSLDGDLESIMACWLSLSQVFFIWICFTKGLNTHRMQFTILAFHVFLLNFLGMVIWSKMDLVLNVLA